MPLSWPSYLEITNQLQSFHTDLNAGEFDKVEEFYRYTRMTTFYPWSDLALVGNPGEKVEGGYGRNLHLYDGLPRVHYMLTNIVLDGNDDEGVAESSSQFVCLIGLPDSWSGPHGIEPEDYQEPPIQIFAAGRYLDKFSRIDDRWRLVHRVCRADFTGDRSRHVKVDLLRAFGVPASVAREELER
jgi:hypothetical protein